MPLRPHLPGFLTGILGGAALSLALWPKHPATPPSPPANSPAPAAAATPITATPITDSLARGPSTREASLTEKLKRLAQSSHPLLRSAELTQLGYDAAGTALNHAITQLDAIPDRPGKLAYLKGLFTRVAEDKPPYEAIQRVKRLSRDLEVEGFKALISQWTGREIHDQLTFEDTYRLLLGHADVSREIKAAWLQAYQNHTNRSSMAAEHAGSLVVESPEEAHALGAEFAGWEREQFFGNLAERWILQDPDAAWDWIAENRPQLPAETIASALELWAQNDPAAAFEAYEGLTEVPDRLSAAGTLARSRAAAEGTQAALAWADGLATVAEQDAAHEAIYLATPRGIGAVLDQDEGSLTIRDILPDTPAHQAGLRKGDRIVQVDPGNGHFQSLTRSADLADAVQLIRGEAGSALRLRILRNGGETEVVELNRQQLILRGSQPTRRNR